MKPEEIDEGPYSLFTKPGDGDGYDDDEDNDESDEDGHDDDDDDDDDDDHHHLLAAKAQSADQVVKTTTFHLPMPHARRIRWPHDVL